MLTVITYTTLAINYFTLSTVSTNTIVLFDVKEHILEKTRAHTHTRIHAHVATIITFKQFNFYSVAISIVQQVRNLMTCQLNLLHGHLP